MAKTIEQNNQTGFELAVIGMSGRFPGAADLDEFWDNLKNGVESISFFSEKELEELGLNPTWMEDNRYVKSPGGVLENREYFDAFFFDYTPIETMIMNPQTRIFLECSWDALEDGGYDSKAYEGSIGIYVGASSSFHWQGLLRMSGKYDELGLFESNFLSDCNFMAVQIAYKLGLKGPALTVHTACSTSLVAIHLASQGVLNGECDMALAGGVTISTGDMQGYCYQEGMIFSPDGHCRAFDAKAMGTSMGYGAGVVLVKALKDAIDDKDHIYAIIKGTAINNDGIRKIGITAPSIEGQAEVIRMALQLGEVESESIDYVETHGTGTLLGDPVEIQGLKLAFDTKKKGYCAIGSVKTNIGHLDTAAGVAGFIKTVLLLMHRLIPPTLHFEIPNSKIDFISTPFYVNTKLEALENDNYPLRAGVSAFGIGGTNAHIVLEEWFKEQNVNKQKTQLNSSEAGEFHVIPLSARTDSALNLMKLNLAEYLHKYPSLNLKNVAYTLQIGRKAFPYRWMTVCSTVAEACEALTMSGGGEIYVVSEGEKNYEPIDIEAAEIMDEPIMLQIGRSWLRGREIDWKEYFHEEERCRVSLPTYPFERIYYWLKGDLLHWAKTITNDTQGESQELATSSLQKTVKTKPESVSLNNRPKLNSAYMSPMNELEKKLVGIWQRFFGIEPIGIDDDFIELGGDSLKVITIVSRIQRELDVLVPIPEFFNAPTIKELAIYITGITQISPYVSIKKVEEKEFYRLSSAQRRQYILYQLDIDNTTYNIPYILQLEGEVNLLTLQDTFKKLLSRHESLRTSFEMTDEEPIQRIHPEVEFEIEYENLKVTVLGHHNIRQRLDEKIKNFIRPFDLSKAPLLRVGLIKEEEKKFILMVDMHHIIADGVSLLLLRNEFYSAYNNLGLLPLKINYKDYSEWQQNHLKEGLFNSQENFWKQTLYGEIPVLNMPSDFPRPVVRRTEGSMVHFSIEPEDVNGLKKIAHQQGVTLFMMLISVYYILLGKLCSQDDIIIGTPIAGRRHTDLEKIFGIFINTLILRNSPSGGKTFISFLKEVKNNTLAAFENQDYPFEDLVEKFVSKRDTSRNPLFDVMFVLQNFEMISTNPSDVEKTRLDVRVYEYEVCTSMFDMNLFGQEVDDHLYFRLEYCTKLFKKETIKRIITYFKSVISCLLENPDQNISSISIIPGDEKERILYCFNDTHSEYPGNFIVQRLIEEQGERILGHTALVGVGAGEQGIKKIGSMGVINREDGTGATRLDTNYLTYGEMNRRANQLAHFIRKRGVTSHSIVAIKADRSIELIIGLLAIMKAGGAYLPLDPNYPQERINYILKDSGTNIMLSTRVFKEITGNGYEVIRVDDRSIYIGEKNNPVNVSKSDDLVYVIYTSGSTGNPKGVLIEHHSLVNFIKSMTEIIDFNENESVLSLTTVSFDIFGLETIVPLTAGTRVVIGTREEQLDMEAAALAIYKEQISILQVTPSGLSMFMTGEEIAKALKSLKYLLVGGEAFPVQLWEKVKKVRKGEIYNLYGPTETTIWSTTRELSRIEVLDIGKPIANTRIYILEVGTREILLPIGITGELFIAGAGLARGYVNQPQLTAEKFIPHSLEGGKRIYFTGDLARWLPDGAIEFIGRVDSQVKIRGFRIELGEIENRLIKHDKIREAVVLARDAANKNVPGNMSTHTLGENQEQAYLCAYIVSDKQCVVSVLREFLSIELPDYMIPSYYIPVEKIPLTPNGKVDRKALESLSVSMDTGTNFIAPRNPIEETIANVWIEILNVEKIGIHDNFFELGGNSLTLIKVRNKLKTITGTNIPAAAMFRFHTIHLLSQYLGQEVTKSDFFYAEIEDDVQMMENTMQALQGGKDEYQEGNE